MNKIKLYVLILVQRFLINGFQMLMDRPVFASIALELEKRIMLLDATIYRNEVRRKLVRVRPISNKEVK